MLGVRLAIIQGLPQALHCLSAPKQEAGGNATLLTSSGELHSAGWARRGPIGVVEAKGAEGQRGCAMEALGGRSQEAIICWGYSAGSQACPFRLLAGILIGTPLTLVCGAHFLCFLLLGFPE